MYTLNVITLGQIKTDNINRMITLTDDKKYANKYWNFYFSTFIRFNIEFVCFKQCACTKQIYLIYFLVNIWLNWHFCSQKWLHFEQKSNFIMQQVKSNNITRNLILLSGFFYWYCNRSDSWLEQSDHSNRMIKLSVIILNSFYYSCDSARFI